MARLKLGPIADEKPVRITAELPASVHRDLVAYGRALVAETNQAIEPAQLIAPMLARFMAADRGFAKLRRAAPVPGLAEGPPLAVAGSRPAPDTG